MPGGTRPLPTNAVTAKQVVRMAMVNSRALPGTGKVQSSHILRHAGPHRTLADLTTTLDALVSDGDATKTGTAYALTNQGLTNYRTHPVPRKRRTA